MFICHLYLHNQSIINRASALLTAVIDNDRDCPSVRLSVCLRMIARGKWQDRIPNTDILNTCGMGIEAFLLKAQLRRVGHILRMPHSRIPKQVFLGKLASGKRLQCGPVLRYKDALKVNLKQCGIDPSALGDDTQDRSAWRTLCHEAVTQFDYSRVEALEHKRAVRKGVQPRSNLSAWPCDSCSRICSSRIGLHAHPTNSRRSPSVRPVCPSVCTSRCRIISTRRSQSCGFYA